MELALTRSLEALVFPPGGYFVLWLTGLLLLWRYARWGKAALWAGLVLSYAASTPLGADALVRPLEAQHAALTEQQIRADAAGAIVVLSAGLYRAAPEFDRADTVDDATLIRLRYAAHLHRLTHLPVIVSGGIVYDRAGSLADAMAETLRNELGVAEVWLEAQSRTTRENATYTKALLDSKQISRVFLVTHALHMPRSVEIFQRVGVEVMPAPTRFFGGMATRDPWRSPVPSAQALEITRSALHEWIGQLWYAVRFW